MHVGATSPGRGLLETVRSMPLWPPDAVLVCRGLVYPEFATMLSAEAHSLRMGARLLIQDVSSFQPDALAHIAAADLGIAFHESHSLNQLYSAFASQKLHQYMAAGVPVLARRGPGFDELVSLAGCGLCVDMSSSEEIGYTVNRMLADEELLRRCGQNGRRLHLNWFNYERVFAPVLNQILGWCGREPLQLAAKMPPACCNG
jgi:glycosyltransferase involved in cell wall biosynthesis